MKQALTVFLWICILLFAAHASKGKKNAPDKKRDFQRKGLQLTFLNDSCTDTESDGMVMADEEDNGDMSGENTNVAANQTGSNNATGAIPKKKSQKGKEPSSDRAMSLTKYYHYTSYNASKQIISSGILEASESGVFGAGIYLTDSAPTDPDKRYEYVGATSTNVSFELCLPTKMVKKKSTTGKYLIEGNLVLSDVHWRLWNVENGKLLHNSKIGKTAGKIGNTGKRNGTTGGKNGCVVDVPVILRTYHFNIVIQSF